jgi:predicted RNA-binding Zn-ribbon protein involved in translation (DUF1610 family)
MNVDNSRFNPKKLMTETAQPEMPQEDALVGCKKCGLLHRGIKCPNCKIIKKSAPVPKQKSEPKVEPPVENSHKKIDWTKLIYKKHGGDTVDVICPHCNIMDWMKIEDLGEDYQCNNCGRTFLAGPFIGSKGFLSAAANFYTLGLAGACSTCRGCGSRDFRTCTSPQQNWNALGRDLVVCNNCGCTWVDHWRIFGQR